MTTKTEMTLENVCFRYDGSKEAENCIDAMNDRTRKVSMSFNGTRGNYYFMANNDKQWDLSKPNELTLISPSDYLLLLSAPESQAHLLTDAFTCIGCGHELPNRYSLRTKGYCYLCDPNITVNELLGL